MHLVKIGAMKTELGQNKKWLHGSVRIGLLEDQPEVAETLARSLEKAGYRCVIFGNGDRLKRFLRQEEIDLLVLDWNVPGESGIDILKWSKTRHPDIPALMLTGRSAPEDIITAFRNGADEYVLKPVQNDVFLARIRALERLIFVKEPVQTTEIFGKFRFNLTQRKLSIGGQEVDLTAKEFALALILFKNHGRTLSRDYLYDTVWETNAQAETRTLDVHISKLRSKAMLTPENGCRLRPIYAYGYRLELDPEQPSS